MIVVVTDGMENALPYVRIGQPAQRIDLTQYAGMTIYTVGLGLGAEVDLGVLTSLATTFEGSFYLTEDRWLTLSKFFVEIFGDTLEEFVTLDPEFELTGPQPFEVDLDLGTVDFGVTFVAYSSDPAVDVELTIVAPGGAVLDAASVAGYPEIRHGSARGYTFYRFALPSAARIRCRVGRAVEKLIARANLPAGQKLAFAGSRRSSRRTSGSNARCSATPTGRDMASSSKRA